jgi:DNA-binding XRE family transcriptional regulator
MTFGAKIRLLRNREGYSQQSVAHMLNLSENSFRKIEKDKIVPKAKRKQQLSKIFGMTMEQLDALG